MTIFTSLTAPCWEKKHLKSLSFVCEHIKVTHRHNKWCDSKQLTDYLHTKYKCTLYAYAQWFFHASCASVQDYKQEQEHQKLTCIARYPPLCQFHQQICDLELLSQTEEHDVRLRARCGPKRQNSGMKGWSGSGCKKTSVRNFCSLSQINITPIC